MRYGNIFVLEDNPTPNRPAKCECLLCGKVWNPRFDGVLYGKIKSCGCLKNNYKDYTGCTFGGVKIIKQTGPSYKKGDCLCLLCGSTFQTRIHGLLKGKVKSCGCFRRRTGNNHHAWKGGFFVTKQGYRKIKRNNKSIFEHRAIMEDYLGRPLKEFETVHHKNGNRLDNRIENLELWASKQPPGQRVEDLVIWAKEILELYNAYSR